MILIYIDALELREGRFIMTHCKKPTCNFCTSVKQGDIYSISKLAIVMKKQTIEVGLLTLLKELNRYVLDKCYHLSASEIVLLRPDILVEFLTHKYDEPIISYSFIENRICQECFIKYKVLVPEK